MVFYADTFVCEHKALETYSFFFYIDTQQNVFMFIF